MKTLRLEGMYSGVRYKNVAIPERIAAAEVFERIGTEPWTGERIITELTDFLVWLGKDPMVARQLAEEWMVEK